MVSQGDMNVQEAKHVLRQQTKKRQIVESVKAGGGVLLMTATWGGTCEWCQAHDRKRSSA